MTGWYGVRCLLHWIGHEGTPYEERITLWRAESIDEAIELAEREAAEYAQDHGYNSVEFAQAYAMHDQPGHGAEVFSLLRDSELPPGQYVDRFFDTRSEHQHDFEPD